MKVTESPEPLAARNPEPRTLTTSPTRPEFGDTDVTCGSESRLKATGPEGSFPLGVMTTLPVVVLCGTVTWMQLGPQKSALTGAGAPPNVTFAVGAVSPKSAPQMKSSSPL